MIEWAQCIDCDKRFQRADDEDWRVRCLSCYKAHKRRTGDRLPAASPSSQRLQTLEAERARLLQTIHDLNDEIERQRAQAEGFHAHLPRLIQLCHPDRHQGSALATETTAWLLQQRRR